LLQDAIVERETNAWEDVSEEHVLFVQEKNAKERKDVSELELEDTENFTVEWELEDIEDTTEDITEKTEDTSEDTENTEDTTEEITENSEDIEDTTEE